MRPAAPTCLRRPVTLSRTTPRSTCVSAGAFMTSQSASHGAAEVPRCACPGTPAAGAEPPAGYGSDHFWSAKSLHVRIWTWVPSVDEPLGSVRHRLLMLSTYSPLDLCFH